MASVINPTGGQSAGNVTSIAPTIPATTAGSMLVLAIGWGSGTASTSNPGAGWTLDKSGSALNGALIEVWRLSNCGAGVTAPGTWGNAGSNGIAWSYIEVTGMGTTPTVDPNNQQTNTVSVATTAFTTTAPSVAGTDDLWVTVMGENGGTANTITAPGNGYTVGPKGGPPSPAATNNAQSLMMYETSPPAATLSTGTGTITSHAFNALVLAYIASAPLALASTSPPLVFTPRVNLTRYRRQRPYMSPQRRAYPAPPTVNNFTQALTGVLSFLGNFQIGPGDFYSTKTQTGVTTFSTGVNYAETDVSWVNSSGNGWKVGMLPGYGAAVISPWYEVNSNVDTITQTSLSTSQQDGFVHMEAVIGANFKGSEQFAYTLTEIAPTPTTPNGIYVRRYYDSGTSIADVNGITWRVRQAIQPGDPGMIFTRIDMGNPSGSPITLTGTNDPVDYDVIAGLTQVLQGGVIAWQAADTGYGFVGGANTTPIPTVQTTGAPDYYYAQPHAGSGISTGVIGVVKTPLTIVSGAGTVKFLAVVNANRMKINVTATTGATVPATTTYSFYFLSALRRSLTGATEAPSLAADYLNPDGAGAFTTGTFTSYSYDEGMYVVAAASNVVAVLHTISGSVTERWNPSYKITSWTNTGSPKVSLSGTGSLVWGTDYVSYVDTGAQIGYVKILKQIVASGAGTGQLNNGTLTFSAGGFFTQVVAGVLSFTGITNLGKAVTNLQVAGLSFTGPTNLRNAIVKLQAAGLTLTGNFTKATSKNLITAGLTFTGVFSKTLGRILTGGLSFTGPTNLGKNVVKLVTGGLSLTGAQTKFITKNLVVAGLSFAGAITKKTTTNLVAAGLSFTGAFASAKIFLKSFTALLSFGQDNLLTRNAASLEFNASDWTASLNCTLTASSSLGGVDGVRSLNLRSIAAGRMDGTTATGTSGIPVVASRTYTAIASFTSSVTFSQTTVLEPVHLYINWYQANGSASSHPQDASAGATEVEWGPLTNKAWIQQTITVTSPSDAAFAALVVSVDTTVAANEFHFMDALSLREGNSTAWTPGYGLNFTPVRLKLDTVKLISAGLIFTGLVTKFIPRTLVGAILSFKYKGLVLSNKPIAYYRLNDTGTTAVDSSGNGNTGTLTGGVTPIAGGLGDDDPAMTFDGATGFITIPASSGLNNLSSSFSIEALINRATTGNINAAIFEKTIGGAVNTQFSLLHDAASITFRIQRAVGGQIDLTYADNLVAGTWHHWVSTYDGSNMRSYLDSILVAGPQASTVPVTGSGVSTIGALNSGSIYFWNGSLDEVAIYDTALTAAQVLSLYNASLPISPKKTSKGLVVAGLSFTGAITSSKTFLRTLTGSLSFTGPTNLLNNIGKNISAGLTFTGNINKSTIKLLSAALSFVGNLATAGGAGHFFQSLTGGLSFTGAMVKTTSKNVTANLTFTGTFLKATQKMLTGGLSFIGVITRKDISTRLSGGLSFTGNTARGIVLKVTLTATLAFTGAMSSGAVIMKSLAGVLNFTGVFTKRPGKTLSGGLTFTGAALSKSIVTRLNASQLFIGGLVKFTTKNLTNAGLSFTGVFTRTRTTSKILAAATLSFTGTFRKQTGKSLTGILSFVGPTNLRLALKTLFQAVLSFAGSLPYAGVSGLAKVGIQHDSVPMNIDIAVTETLPFVVDVSNYLVAGDTITNIYASLINASTGAPVTVTWRNAITLSGNFMTIPIIGSTLSLGVNYQMTIIFKANTNKISTFITYINVVA